LFKRSPSIAEVDGFSCFHRLNGNHRGAVHNGAGISRFLAQFMVGNMYRICCFNVCRGVGLLFCCKRNNRTVVTEDALLNLENLGERELDRIRADYISLAEEAREKLRRIALEVQVSILSTLPQSYLSWCRTQSIPCPFSSRRPKGVRSR
jgi:hypothetical protein